MKPCNRLHTSLCFLFLCMSLLIALPETARAEASAQYEEVLLKVDGIACFTCRWAIAGRLQEIPGVKAAKVTSRRLTWWNPFSKSEGRARITYEAGAVTVDQLIAAIEGASDAVYTYKASLFPEPARKEQKVE
ncbi:MAG: heavy-metal-associated domain-containing protein [Nitrospiria bacterium]